MVTPEVLVQDYPEFRDLDWLAVFGYYDGPLSGTALVDGKKVWASCTYEYDSGQRLYEITAPDEASWDEINKRKDAFHKYVGTHWNYEIPESERTTRPMEEWSKFYAMFSPSDRWDVSGETIGWYRW